jgi:hypothetical protein
MLSLLLTQPIHLFLLGRKLSDMGNKLFLLPSCDLTSDQIPYKYTAIYPYQ